MLTVPDFIQIIDAFNRVSKGNAHPQVIAARKALANLVEDLPKDELVLVDDENTKSELQQLLQKANEHCEQIKQDIIAYQKNLKDTKTTESPSGGDFLQQVAPNN